MRALQRTGGLAAGILALQRTHGNRAVARMIGGSRATRRVLQRVIRITPEMYARGRGTTVDAMVENQEQLRTYLGFAVLDDYKLACGYASDADKGNWAALVKTINDKEQDAATRAAALNTLVAQVNQQVTGITVDEPHSAVGGGPQTISLPNRRSRYSTAPEIYRHTEMPQGTAWTGEQDMRDKFAVGFAQLGPFASRPARGRDKDAPPVYRIPWATAKRLLPRPLLKLIFDVRYQLESTAAAPVVIDERTPDELHRSYTTPLAPGTLRSWHTDADKMLPQPENAAMGVGAGLLQQHYAQTSGRGSGASQTGTAAGPTGFAEYTGTGAGAAHNVKVVVDYISKRIFVTLSHYQYWVLLEQPVPETAPPREPFEFLELRTAYLRAAVSAFARHMETADPRPVRAQLMSPWIEIEVD